MHRTYLQVKAVRSGGERIIEGWATTPREDLVGDQVVPEGCKFTLPLPLLFNHDHGQPIGAVLSATVTRAGIRIRAKITEGVARSEEIWKLLQDGALNAVSIGFKALDATRLANGGMRFNSWTLMEISVVAVPCNPDARISIGKSMAYADGSVRQSIVESQSAQLGYAKATRATGASSIKVVVGPPCAGKTTYVLSQMKAGDVRVDYDEIAKAFGSNKAHDATGPVREVALAARQSAIYRVMRGVEADAWIIHTNPREEMIKDYDLRGADFIMVNPGKEDCLARAKNRPEGTSEAIEDWFKSPPILPKHETVKTMLTTATKPSSQYFERIAHAVKTFVTTSIQPLDEKVMALEEQITRIQSKGVAYRGIYNQSDVYVRGDLVTHGGSIFHAARNTAGISPAHGGEERKALDHPWQLAVRRGRDSK